MTASLGAVVLALSCLIPEASASPEGGPRRRDFEDQVRCRFILEELCSRLTAGDRAGAAAFMIGTGPRDLGSLPDDRGLVASCRPVLPESGRDKAKLKMVLGYASGPPQEVGLRFAALGRRECGFVSELQVAGRRPRENDGPADGSAVQWIEHSDGSVDMAEGGEVRWRSKADPISRLKPERDDSPRAAYIRRVLEQIDAERERREAGKDPLNRPLIQKE